MNWIVLLFGLVGLLCCLAPVAVVFWLRKRREDTE